MLNCFLVVVVVVLNCWWWWWWSCSAEGIRSMLKKWRRSCGGRKLTRGRWMWRRRRRRIGRTRGRWRRRRRSGRGRTRGRGMWKRRSGRGRMRGTSACEIADHAGCGSSRTYYFRVRAHLDDKKRALFDLVVDRKEQYSYYQVNNRGMVVVKRVAAYVKECLRRMKAGQMPPAEVDGNLPIRWF